MESANTPCGAGAWRAVFVSHHIVVERIEESLAEAGLPPLSWYDVLLTVAKAPEQRLRMFEVAEGIVMSRSGLTRLVDRIESNGYLRRESCPSDRRGTHLALTDEGAELLERALPVYSAAVQQHFLRHLPDAGAVETVLQPVIDAARAARKPCTAECAAAEAAEAAQATAGALA
jgi:DNA-binding MarR family transcriptional regulator